VHALTSQRQAASLQGLDFHGFVHLLNSTGQAAGKLFVSITQATETLDEAVNHNQDAEDDDDSSGALQPQVDINSKLASPAQSVSGDSSTP
jgi:hypothetical protein